MEKTARYYAYMKRSIKGPLYPVDLARLPGFDASTLVCPEKKLGQWREARYEKAFEYFLASAGEGADAGAGGKTPAMTPRIRAENTALKPVLENVIRKNSEFENEIKKLKRDYAEEKRRFEKILSRKENEIKNLVEKLKRTRLRISAKEEHPSWEILYKTYKKRMEEKMAQALEEIAAKAKDQTILREKYEEEISKIRREKEETEKRAALEREKSAAEIRELRSELEEKEIILKSYDENMRSVMGRNEELQKILFEEKNDYEERIRKFCDEIGALKSELKWKGREMEKIKTELFLAMEKIREFEALNSIKNDEQREIYNAIKMKLKILAGYFENLESRIRYAFKKA